MLLRRAGGAAARLAASSASCDAARATCMARLPLQLLQRRRPLAAAAGGAGAAARAVAVAPRATVNSSSSSSPPTRGFASASAATGELTAADHHAICQLLYRFDDYLNSGRHDEVGVFFVGGGGGGGGGGGEQQQQQAVVRVLQPGAASPVAHAGVPAIAAFFRACAPMARGNRHLLLNPLVVAIPSGPGGGCGDSVGDRGGAMARARVRSARLLVSATNPPVLRASGVVEDVLVREGSSPRAPATGGGVASGGEWRILSRDLVMDPPAANAASNAASAAAAATGAAPAA